MECSVTLVLVLIWPLHLEQEKKLPMYTVADLPCGHGGVVLRL